MQKSPSDALDQPCYGHSYTTLPALACGNPCLVVCKVLSLNPSVSLLMLLWALLGMCIPPALIIHAHYDVEPAPWKQLHSLSLRFYKPMGSHGQRRLVVVWWTV